MELLFVLIALALVGSFLYGLLAMWRHCALVFLHPAGRTQKDRWGLLVTMLIATSLPAWFAWQVWMAYGF